MRVKSINSKTGLERKTNSKNGQAYWHPQWGDGLLHTLTDGSQIAVFPLWRETSVQYYDIGYIRRLVIKLDADGEIISGKILEMVSSKEYLRVHKEDIPVRFYEGTLQNSDALAWESELDNSQKSKNIGDGSCVPHTTFTTGPDGCTVFVIQECGGVIRQAQIFEGACTSGGGFGGPPPQLVELLPQQIPANLEVVVLVLLLTEAHLSIPLVMVQP